MAQRVIQRLPGHRLCQLPGSGLPLHKETLASGEGLNLQPESPGGRGFDGRAWGDPADAGWAWQQKRMAVAVLI